MDGCSDTWWTPTPLGRPPMAAAQRRSRYRLLDPAAGFQFHPRQTFRLPRAPRQVHLRLEGQNPQHATLRTRFRPHVQAVRGIHLADPCRGCRRRRRRDGGALGSGGRWRTGRGGGQHRWHRAGIGYCGLGRHARRSGPQAGNRLHLGTEQQKAQDHHAHHRHGQRPQNPNSKSQAALACPAVPETHGLFPGCNIAGERYRTARAPAAFRRQSGRPTPTIAPRRQRVSAVRAPASERWEVDPPAPTAAMAEGRFSYSGQARPQEAGGLPTRGAA